MKGPEKAAVDLETKFKCFRYEIIIVALLCGAFLAAADIRGAEVRAYHRMDTGARKRRKLKVS